MKSITRLVSQILAVSLLSVFLGIGGTNVIAQGNGGGGGGGGGGQGGSGEAPDLGDMWVLYRDANGVPILTPSVQVLDPETGGMVAGGLCQQPLAAPGVRFTLATGENCTLVGDSCLVPVDPLTCAIVVGFETYTQEIDFGRMNVARAPASVMDRQLADMLVTLSTAQCLTLDAAGRLAYLVPDTADVDGDGDTTELIYNEVDSPLQNLAIYREMMTKGALGDPPIVLPNPPGIPNYGFLDTAAKGVGAASDKGGKISVDLVVYLNQMLGLSDSATVTTLPKICQSYRAEVQGKMQLVEKCYLNYGQHAYQRSGTYGNLPYPAYVPAADPLAGYFEFLTEYPGATGPSGEVLFWITAGPILKTVFPDGIGGYLPGFVGGNIGGFAQASDDARAVIEFMHSHPVMAGYGTQAKCAGQPPVVVTYDLALSQLQMPRSMVAGKEREGSVAITNAGPDAASGIVTVVGTDSKGVVISQGFVFADLAAGGGLTWPIVFTAPNYATTITWKATVIADHDVLSSNNTMSATTKVFAVMGGTR